MGPIVIVWVLWLYVDVGLQSVVLFLNISITLCVSHYIMISISMYFENGKTYGSRRESNPVLQGWTGRQVF